MGDRLENSFRALPRPARYWSVSFELHLCCWFKNLKILQYYYILYFIYTGQCTSPQSFQNRSKQSEQSFGNTNRVIKMTRVTRTTAVAWITSNSIQTIVEVSCHINYAVLVRVELFVNYYLSWSAIHGAFPCYCHKT